MKVIYRTGAFEIHCWGSPKGIVKQLRAFDAQVKGARKLVTPIKIKGGKIIPFPSQSEKN